MKAALKLLVRCVLYTALSPWYLMMGVAITLFWAFDEYETPWIKFWKDL